MRISFANGMGSNIQFVIQCKCQAMGHNYLRGTKSLPFTTGSDSARENQEIFPKTNLKSCKITAGL